MVTSHLSQTRDAILVFDQGYWQPDHGLWESVQGVGSPQYTFKYLLTIQAEWKDVILDEEFKERLQRDYRSFYKSEKIYKDLQVPWKRGLIFLGVSHGFYLRSTANVPASRKRQDHQSEGDHA